MLNRITLIAACFLLVACPGALNDARNGPQTLNPGGTGSNSSGLCVVPDFYCPQGKICFEGVCKDDACTDTWLGCSTGSCKPTCVAIEDACENKTCASGETCVDGHCVKGCFEVPCSGVSCADGQYCSPADGKCHALTVAAGIKCKQGFA